MDFQSRQPGLQPAQLSQTVQAGIRAIPKRITRSGIRSGQLTDRLAITDSGGPADKTGQHSNGGLNALPRLDNCAAIHTHSMTGGTDNFAGADGPGAAPPVSRAGFDRLNQRGGSDRLNQRVGFDRPNQRVGFDRPNQRVGFDKLNQRVGFDKLNHRVGSDKLNHRVGFDKLNQRAGFDRLNQRAGFDKPAVSCRNRRA
jgi:hypothetical protein